MQQVRQQQRCSSKPSPNSRTLQPQTLTQFTRGKSAGNVKWRLAVVDDAATPNACVTPDGTIFVMTGLLAMLADENNGMMCGLRAINGVLNHEP